MIQQLHQQSLLSSPVTNTQVFRASRQLSSHKMRSHSSHELLYAHHHHQQSPNAHFLQVNGNSRLSITPHLQTKKQLLIIQSQDTKKNTVPSPTFQFIQRSPAPTHCVVCHCAFQDKAVNERPAARREKTPQRLVTTETTQQVPASATQLQLEEELRKARILHAELSEQSEKSLQKAQHTIEELKCAQERLIFLRDELDLRLQDLNTENEGLKNLVRSQQEMIENLKLKKNGMSRKAVANKMVDMTLGENRQTQNDEFTLNPHPVSSVKSVSPITVSLSRDLEDLLFDSPMRQSYSTHNKVLQEAVPSFCYSLQSSCSSNLLSGVH